MNLTSQNWAALMPLLVPAAAACLIPIASLDKDQDTVKSVRAAMFGMALLALGVSFFYFTRIWATGQNVFFSHLKMDRLGQFSGIFVTVAAMMALLQLWDHLHHEGWMKGETLSLLLFSAVGMMLFASTTNLLMMFLGLELLSLPLYVLTATVRFREESIEGGMKYFITGAVASSCFLMGTVLLYGLTGTLELDGIGTAILTTGADPLVLVGAVLLLMGFLFKISAVPFHQWTPDAYEASPHPIAGFMSVATKGVAVIALMRAFPGAIGLHTATGQRVGMALAVLAAATMIIGNLSALPQTNVKRMLAYSSISHAGYLLSGVCGWNAGSLYGRVVLSGHLSRHEHGGLRHVDGLWIGGRAHSIRGSAWPRLEAPGLGGGCRHHHAQPRRHPAHGWILREVFYLQGTGEDRPRGFSGVGSYRQPGVRLLLFAGGCGPVP